MMFHRRRASPKHRYSIIEVDYGGGGHRTWLRDQQINCCVSKGCPPAPVYKGARGVWPAKGEGAPGGGLLPLGVGLPPFPSWNRIRGGGGEEEREEEGGPAPSPCPIRTKGGRGARPPPASFSLLPQGPCRPNNPPGGSGNPPVLR